MLSTIVQGNRSVSDYFTKLNIIREDLRTYRPLPHYSCGSCNRSCFEKFIKMNQKDYVYKFLNGLNGEFFALRSQILVLKPFPSLDEVYNLVL